MQSSIRLPAILALAAVLAGCATPPVAGLPRGAQKVGGGLAVEWRGERAGTVIIYDSLNKRIVTTRSLDSGEYFRFPSDETDEQVLQAFYPDRGDAAKARFELFFVPGVKE